MRDSLYNRNALRLYCFTVISTRTLQLEFVYFPIKIQHPKNETNRRLVVSVTGENLYLTVRNKHICLTDLTTEDKPVC